MPRPGHAEVALITGFPSSYARRLVEHVLAQGAFVYVVVPAARTAEAATILETLDAGGKRTSLLEGDPSSMDLGLSGAEFRQIATEVDIIHHAAHCNRVGVDEATAHRTNVLSAAEIIELARASSALGCLVFHSTTAVVGHRTGLVYETDLDTRQTFHDDIEKTRWRAEQVARSAMKDVPIAIVRPSHIVGASDPTEQLDTLHVATLLALTTPPEITLPLPQKGDAPVHVVPMRFVAQAAHALGRTRASAGKTFHLVDPHPLAARRFFDLVSRYARKPAFASMPTSSAGTLFRTPGIENIVRHPKSFLEKLTSPVRFEAATTTSLLSKMGVECPPVETYVHDLIAEVEEHVRLRVRRKQSSASSADAEISDPLG